MNLSETRRQMLFDLVRVLITLLMVALAAGGVFWVTQKQQAHPWTRDGQVLANVVHVAPQVSGPVVAVHVADNQRVAQGDPLFEIDPTLFQQAVQQAEADLAQASAEATDAAADARRAQALHARGDLSQQDFDLKTAQAEAKAATVDAAKVALETARLKLGYTKVSATSTGYVTNLDLDAGTYATAGESVLALIDANSFWVAGYFKETDLPYIAIGDPAAVTLMGHPDRPLAGHVESIAFGIARRNTGTNLGDLAKVAPTFEWIRLAQRIPVRIALASPPADLPLRVGYTASVAINPSRTAERR
ncbi:MAG: efflux transporter periplasmic adaptor subunit [Halochromatium sp.]|nr:efflux transporter periplasmic adaptor subunit [Halochromatium sp.]